MATQSLKLAELALAVGAELRGNPEQLIQSVATIQSATDGQIAFVANSRYRKYLARTTASAVILKTGDAAQIESPGSIGQPSLLVSDNPYLAYARIAALLNPPLTLPVGRHATAVVADDAVIADSAFIAANVVIESGVQVGKGSYIGPGCVLGRDTVIGENCHLVANVTLYHELILGDRVLIQAGVVIGADGFGFANDQGRWVKVPQLGRVVIGDDVEIGANTTVDRGALDDTIIAAGVKLDNQVQVAHNVRIGEGTAIAGCVGIAGSTVIGRRCQIGGGVGIVGHLQICDDAHVTAMSLVTGNILKPGLYSSGTALEPNKQWQKNATRFKKLDELARQVKRIQDAD